jgi:hypothetical protein
MLIAIDPITRPPVQVSTTATVHHCRGPGRAGICSKLVDHLVAANHIRFRERWPSKPRSTAENFTKRAQAVRLYTTLRIVGHRIRSDILSF